MNARVLPSLCRLALPVLVAAALHPASAQNATTIPVGYIKSVSLGSNSTSNITANTDVSISLPLKRPVVFASAVASVSGSNVTIQNATFGAGNLTTEPHLLEIASGNQTGVAGLITSHNATTCTVDIPSGLSLSGVVAGDAVRIRKAWTPSSIFSGNITVPVGAQLQLWSGSNAGTDLAPDVLIEYDGANWVDLTSFEIADNLALYAGEMMLLRSTSAITGMVLVGEVPAYTTKLALSNVNGAQPQDLYIAYNSPVPEVLGNSSVNSVAAAGDQIQVIDNSDASQNKAPATLLEFDGASWIDLVSFEDVTNTYVLQPGIGIGFRRGATNSTVTWNQTPSYLPLP